MLRFCTGVPKAISEMYSFYSFYSIFIVFISDQPILNLDVHWTRPRKPLRQTSVLEIRLLYFTSRKQKAVRSPAVKKKPRALSPSGLGAFRGFHKWRCWSACSRVQFSVSAGSKVQFTWVHLPLSAGFRVHFVQCTEWNRL